MNRREKDEINKLPDKYRPIGAWGYLGYQILFSLPLVGFICLVIFALSDSNINRRSFARMYFLIAFLVILLFAVVITVILVTIGGDFSSILDKLPIPKG